MNRATIHHVPIDLIDYDVLPAEPGSYRQPHPPVKLQMIEGGRFKLKDGRHRLAAARRAGHGTILARYKERSRV